MRDLRHLRRISVRSGRAAARKIRQMRARTAPVPSVPVSVATDVIYQVLAGRGASVEEIREMESTAGGAALLGLAQRLKETPEGARVAVHGAGPAIRTYARGRFEPGSGRAPAPRLVFLHFMKVGGTSLCDVLAGWFAPEDAMVHVYVDDLALLPPSVLATLRVIAGHIPFAALPLIPGPFRTLAALRDPVARTMSHWSTLKRSDPAFAGLTLDQFVSDDTFAALSGNYQARQLAHDIGLAEAWRSFNPENLVAASGGDPLTAHPLASLFDSGPLSLADDQLLGVASEHLATIDYVGTTDDLDALIRPVAALFGRAGVAVPRLNTSAATDRDNIAGPLRRRIEERTSVDIELYQAARRRADPAV